MKRILVLFLTALLTLTVCGCSKSRSTTYTVTRNGTEYVVNQENGTISDGTYTYQYTLSVYSSGYSVHITYPDGSTYSWRTQTNGSGSGTASVDSDAQR